MIFDKYQKLISGLIFEFDIQYFLIFIQHQFKSVLSGYPISRQNSGYEYKKISFLKRKEYVYLKSHIFSYIDDYAFNFYFIFSLPVMNRLLLNAKKS